MADERRVPVRSPLTINPTGSAREGPDHVAVVAHRGASAYVCENTLGAVRTAIELGADWVEIDVRRSSDGALVVMHDKSLVRTTNVRAVFPNRAPWNVADFTYDELRLLTTRPTGGRRGSPERIPTLHDVIAVLRDRNVGLLVELKEPHLYPDIVTDVIRALQGGGRQLGDVAPSPQCIVQSFDFAAMKELKAREPEIRVALLGTPALSNLPALASWADQVHCRSHSIDRRYVDRAHHLGMGCMAWTANRKATMRRAIRTGVDGVISDCPDLLREIVSHMGMARDQAAGFPARTSDYALVEKTSSHTR
jgi:glycerophosphoryl diester phosphodiesterase